MGVACTLALFFSLAIFASPATAAGGASVNYGLELASADISWRVCRAGFSDPMFSGVCPAASDHNPLHVAVTVSATWWAAPGSLGPEGPGKWTADADPAQQHVLLPAEAGSVLARRIGWKAAGGGTLTLVAPNAGSADGYAFAVTHAEKLSTKTNTSLHHVSTRLSFMVALPHAGEFEVEFSGCCRYPDLANIRQADYPHHVPWHVSARIVASTDSVLAPSFSPRLSMPITQVVMWDLQRTAFRLYADNGGVLFSIVDDMDIAGRYLETTDKMSLDSSVYVITNTRYAAYVREDGLKSILWFDAPETGKHQFSTSGSWTSGPGWVVIRGDVRKLVGLKPSALPSRPVLEGLGGVWPSLPMYNDLQYMGPSYQGGGVVQTAAKKTNALVEYEHVVKLHKLMPFDSLLPTEISQGTPTFELGTLSAPAFMPDGTMLDTHEGVLVLSPASYKDLCKTLRNRAPKLQVCAMALPVTVNVASGDLRVSVSLDFWVQVLEPKTMDHLYTDHAEYVAYPLNPLPRLVFPNDTTPGNEGMALYASAEKSLQMACDTTRELIMPVAGVPSLAALSVNRLHSTVWTRAVPLAAATQSDDEARTPVTMLVPVPSAWHSSDAWDIAHVAVSGTDVKLTLAPKCDRKGSRGLQMVCLEVMYALDDHCMGDANVGCNPSNYGCRLENANSAGRCYATSAPSRCLYYTVTNPAETAVPRHTAPPMPAETLPPTTPPPAPTQPVIDAVAEPPVAQNLQHIQHVLDLVAHLPDPHIQIQRGELSMYFVEDLAMLKMGQPPVDTLRVSFDAQVTGCLCAGSRDLTLQRSLLDQWNKQKNDLDFAARSVWYKMGEELKGQTVSLDHANYEWSCIAEVKLDVKKALTREIVSGNATEGCVLCWHEYSDAHSRC